MAEDKKSHKEYERKMYEKAASLSKTREELVIEDPQRLIPDSPYMTDCDCEGEQTCISQGSSI